MEPGQTAERTTAFSSSPIEAFAEISGDHNPIHLDERAASESRFGKRIAHGMLVASTISAILAEDLPGPGTIYLGQSLKFVAPVFVGDQVTTRVTALRSTGRHTWIMSTECFTDSGELVITGEASVLLE